MDPDNINTSSFIVMQGTSPVAGIVSYTNGTATFTPADNLAPLTTYTVTINTGAKDLAGNALTSDITWNFTTGVAPDTTAPVLGASGPANGDTNVPLNETITATFKIGRASCRDSTYTSIVPQRTKPKDGHATQ